ncbi:methyl-accepting chemotaxis protein [Vreelandella populi]|uniref:HAMP domain-containing protein n=1 Tax=Vreelandella populi TaxID=2498858 RepID=A0A433LCE7_9GAMM|nr:methyl-accepting chemotaxis protein [Halomonas populi]RUR39246.1 HAMP domain-containing protein [Halomonas populi]RUR46358.1 HAMP domain-containing protein [Halomonas populi]
MKDFPVKYALAGALGLLITMLVLVATLGIQAEKSAVTSLNELDEVAAHQVAFITQTEVNLMQIWVRLERLDTYSERGETALAQRSLEFANASLKLADTRLDAFLAIRVPNDSPRAPLVATIESEYQRLISDSFRRDLEAGDIASLMGHRDRFNEQFETFTSGVRDFNQNAQELAETTVSNAHKRSQRDMFINIGLIFLALVVYVIVQLGINRLIVRPLQRAVALCESVAQGNLTNTIESRGRNEIGRLYSAMNDMQAKLQKMIETLSQSSSAVASSSKEIASGSQDLASRTEQQAAALQQTAASMDEISSIVRQNADTASQAEQLTVNAASKAEHGQTEAKRAGQWMQELEKDSHKVHDIVQVIDSIAFQTNILALNASVEAARAGEHGRGFAVVASEVRSLATKTSNSSKEIRTMIEDIAQRIAEGANQAMHNGESMGEVNTAIRHVTDMMQELTLAAKEQESGIAQISTAIAQMDSATQENVSLVEETSTASASLEGEASRLAELVSAFKLPNTGQPVSLARAPSLKPTASLPPSKPAALRKNTTSEPEWEAF